MGYLEKAAISDHSEFIDVCEKQVDNSRGGLGEVEVLHLAVYRASYNASKGIDGCERARSVGSEER